jgi:NAD(P)-dependent dehydrogenase (short-subunit alcohol dehydrogenase family)
MSQPFFDLTNKVALITGAAQGLGAAVAEALLVQGASAVITDLNADALKATAAEFSDRFDNRVTALECDVSDKQKVDDCVAKAVDRFGRIDILINNAGIHRRVDPLDWDQQDVDALIQVNMLGCFHVASAVGRVMVAQRSGSIVNMSALGGGVVGLGRAGSMYAMTKGAIVSLTRDLAAEWGKYSIRVNALAPGWIRTPMTAALQNHPERAQKVLERVPLQTWGEPEDVAGAAVFLASDASRYITGMTIPVDGGAANVIAISND